MQITKRNGGGTVVYDSADWRAGLLPQAVFASNQNLKYNGTNGFSGITNPIDPFTSYGILSPGTAPSSNATNNSSLGGQVVALELTDNSNGLGVDAGGKIQSININTNTISVAGAFPHTIAFAAGATYVGQDGILYRHNSGGVTPADSKVSFFYSAYNSNNWDIGAYVALATFDDDFMSSIPTTPLDITTGDGDDVTQRTAPHFMETGADGLLYIGSGRYLHAYDGNTGNNGTFNSKVLTLPQGTQVIGLEKFKDILLIACNFYSNGTTGTSGLSGTGQALLYTWDYTSLDITDVTNLEDFFVSSLFIWKGSPTVVTSGANSTNGGNKVKVVSGNSVSELASFDGIVPSQRGVVISSDIIYMNAGGKILAVGDKFRKSDTRVINHIASLGTTGASGVLLYNTSITNINLTGSASNGSSTYVFNNINNGKGAGACRLPLCSPGFPPGKMGRLNYVEIEYFQTLSAGGTNGNLTLTVDADSSTTSNIILTNKSSVASPMIRRYTKTTTGDPLSRFSMFEVIMSWVASNNGNSPTISKITIDYDDVIEITN